MTLQHAQELRVEGFALKRTGQVLRLVAGILASLVLALALFTFRQVSQGEEHMRLSDDAFNRDDLQAAILHARAAATAFAPGAPHVKRAYQRLQSIAVGAEASARETEALSAWRAVRSAALETRHLWIGMPDQLNRANDNIARLTSRAEGASVDQRRVATARAQGELSRDDAPSGRWLIALSLGFFAALSGLAWVGLSGVTQDGKLVLARAKWGAILALLGAALWAVSAWQA